MSTSSVPLNTVLKRHLPSFLNGIILGIALLTSNLHHPSILHDQFTLQDTYFLRVFLVANLVSIFVVYFANKSGFAELACRKDTTFWGWRFSGNVLGGALQGLGMCLADADPGTALVQFALGIGGWSRVWAVIAGCVAGGVVFVAVEPVLKRWKESKTAVKVSVLSLQDVLGMSAGTTAALYAVLCAATIATVNVLDSGSDSLSQMNGYNALRCGSLIGLAQLCSVMLTRKTLGVSSVFEDLARYITDRVPAVSVSPAVQPQADKSKGGSVKAKPSATMESQEKARAPFVTSAAVFSAGIILSARMLAAFLPATIPGDNVFTEQLSKEASVLFDVPAALPSNASSFAGGALLMFGARLAGGCTSGHGISGMATLSLASFITVASIFAVGTLAGLVLG